MAKGKDHGKDSDDGEMLRLAVDYFERILRELDATLQELEHRDGEASTRAKTQAVDVRKAIQVIFEERQRLEKLREKDPASEAGQTLDLDEARAEIGRRLSRLRAALGECDVLRGPE